MLAAACDNSDVSYRCRGSPEILGLHYDVELSIVPSPLHAWRKNAQFDVGAFGRYERRGVGVGGISRAGGLSDTAIGKPERYEQAKESDKGQSNCPAPKTYLFFGGIRGPYLGLQIFALTLVGVAFAGVGARGVIWALDNPNVKGRLLGGALALFGLIVGVTFNGWAALGHPLRFWCGD